MGVVIETGDWNSKRGVINGAKFSKLFRSFQNRWKERELGLYRAPVRAEAPRSQARSAQVNRRR
jgi:hypothetical protein